MRSEVWAGTVEPFPVMLLSHRNVKEIKFTLRAFRGCSGVTAGCSVTEIKTNTLPGPRRAAVKGSLMSCQGQGWWSPGDAACQSRWRSMAG